MRTANTSNIMQHIMQRNWTRGHGHGGMDTGDGHGAVKHARGAAKDERDDRSGSQNASRMMKGGVNYSSSHYDLRRSGCHMYRGIFKLLSTDSSPHAPRVLQPGV
jgi:hypothetical protein